MRTWLMISAAALAACSKSKSSGADKEVPVDQALATMTAKVGPKLDQVGAIAGKLASFDRAQAYKGPALEPTRIDVGLDPKNPTLLGNTAVVYTADLPLI